jgi:4'-phosphopantetheinyl transferase
VKAYIAWLQDDTSSSLDTLIPFLPDSEKQRLATLSANEQKRHHILSRSLLCLLIKKVTGTFISEIQFSRADSGRLLLTHPKDWYISISHTQNAVAVIIAQAACGIDIEVPRKVRIQSLADRYFSTEEKLFLQVLPESEKTTPFFRLWTLKEAAVKACGVGLAQHLSHFAFDVSSCYPKQIRGEPLQLWQQEYAGFFTSAAVQTTTSIQWLHQQYYLSDLLQP